MRPFRFARRRGRDRDPTGVVSLLIVLAFAWPAEARSQVAVRLAGTVVREGPGLPLAGVTVSVAGREAVTDADGRYEITDLEAVADRRAPARAAAAGFFIEERSAPLDCIGVAARVEGDGTVCTRHLDFHMRPVEGLFEASAPACTLVGRLTSDGAEGSHEGATIEVEGGAARALTDSAGRFTLVDVPAGLYHVRARSLGFHEERRQVLLGCRADSPPLSLTFRMRGRVIH